MYTANGTYYSFHSVVLVGLESIQDKRQSSKKNNKYQLLYTHVVHPDDGPGCARNI